MIDLRNSTQLSNQHAQMFWVFRVFSLTFYIASFSLKVIASCILMHLLGKLWYDPWLPDYIRVPMLSDESP
jgi:hypothetical protein